VSLELLVALFRDRGRRVLRRYRTRRPGDPEDDRVFSEPIDPEDDRVFSEPIDPEDDRVFSEPIDPEDDRVFSEPIDPEDDRVFSEPIDPEDDRVFSEPIDPEDDRVFSEPIDPEDDRVFSEPIDPEDDRVFSEPIDPQVAAALGAAAGGCGCGCSPRRRRRRRRPEYSGALVVRLAERPVPFAAPGAPAPPDALTAGATAEAAGAGPPDRPEGEDEEGGRERRPDPQAERPGAGQGRPGDGGGDDGDDCGDDVRRRPPKPPRPPADAAELFGRRIEETLRRLAAAERDAGKAGGAGPREADEQRVALHALQALPRERLVRSLSPKAILDLERRAEQSALPPIHSLTSYCRVEAGGLPAADVRRMVRVLGGLPWVDLAYREVAAADPSLTGLQHYLDRGPTGIGAREAWRMGGKVRGDGVRVIDLEQGWRPHAETPDPAATLFWNDNRAEADPLYTGDHGAAVVGELVAEHGSPDLGVQGIAPGSELHLLSHFRAGAGGSGGSNGHVADAVLAAVAALTGTPLSDGTEPPRLERGDVLLVEVQRALRPCEIDHADFDALRLASALGLIVVEAAGNGGHDLDAYRDERGRASLARGRNGFRESGAIVVGAASDEPGHDRLASSCFGRRVDCFGWGRGVVSTGYGDLGASDAAPAGPYTRRFSGTSAAAPMVAGVAALVQSVYASVAGNRLSNLEMRALLADRRTGTRQGRRVRGAIGVMPDAAAILARLGVGADVRLADPGDPLGRGAGAGQPLAISPAAGGQVVHVCNLGTATARARVTLFSGPVSPLVFPDRWTEVGREQADVPPGAPGALPTPVGPFGGAPAGPASFLALIDDGSRPAPALPPAESAYFRLGDLLRCLRRHRAQCVADVAVPGGSGPLELEFSLFGCPGVPHAFTWEIVRRLPQEVEVRWEGPAFLVSELSRGRDWKRDDPAVPERVRLPSRPRTRTSPVRLPADEQACKLVLQGANAAQPGHGVVLIQRWRGREVGRVTWRFV